MADRDERRDRLEKLLGIAAVGLGATVLAFRTGAIEKIAGFLDDEVRAFGAAFKRITQEEATPGGLRTILSRDGLRSEYNRFIRFFREARSSPPSRLYRIEDIFEDRRRFLDEWGFRLKREGVRTRVEEFIDAAIAQRQRETEFGRIFSRLTGYRRATVSDLLEAGYGSREFRDWLKNIAKYNPGALVDRGIYIKDGRIVDLRAITSLPEKVMEWLEPGLIGKLGHFRDIRASRNMPEILIIKSDLYHKIVQPAITGGLSAIPQGDVYLYAGGRIAPIFHPEKALQDEFMLFEKFGTVSRLYRRMVGLEKSRVPEGSSLLQRLGKLLDIGGQNVPTKLDKILSIFRKFGDKRWIGNIAENLLAKGTRPSDTDLEDMFKSVSAFFGSKTRPFTQRVFDILTEAAGLERYEVYTNEKIIETLRRLGAPERSRLHKRFLALQYNPRSVLNRIGIVSDKMPVFGGSFALSGYDILKKEIGEELIHRIGPDKAQQIIIDALASGRISKREAEITQYLISKTIYDIFYKRYLEKETREQGLKELLSLFKGSGQVETRFQESFRQFVKQYSGFLHYGPMMEEAQGEIAEAVGDIGDYLVMKRGPGFVEAIRELIEKNETTKLSSFFKQFIAGRDDIENITLSTLVPYYGFARLAEALSNIGIPYIKNFWKFKDWQLDVLRLGLSSASMGSTLDVAAGLLLKRVLPVAAAIGTFKYLSWEVGNLTGLSLGQRWTRTRAQIALDISRFTDEEDKREYELHPGYDQLGELPIIGGLFNEPRTYEEMIEYFKYGRDPVRKGRYWLLSRGPYTGGKIEYWRPNWYRMGVSEWQYTDTLYGEGGYEYWRHSWLPSPRYPLAPLMRVLDPYWMERLHALDRPYPLTGDFFEPYTPWGVLLNPTIGQLIKPTIPMISREDLARINEDIKELAERKRSVYAIVTPSGAVNIRELRYISAPEGMYQEEPGATEEGGIIATDIAGGTGAGGGIVFPSVSGTASTGGVIPPVIGVGSGSATVRGQLESINRSIQAQGIVPAGGLWTSVPFDLATINRMYEAQNVIDPTSLGARLGDITYVAREMLGIYGWGSEVMFGSPYENEWIAEKADVMYSMERRWWDKRLGGLGGMLSELGRRFLPHRRHDVNYWNPIPNLMPEWMPGPNYIIDFQHGDPYCVHPDTLIEVGELGFIRAGDVRSGDTIITHKGNHIPVKRVAIRLLKENKKAYKLKVASLVGVDMIFSEEHPILVVDNPSQRRGCNQYVRVGKYERANQILELIKQGINRKYLIAQHLAVGLAVIIPIIKMLEADGKIKDNGRRQPLTLIDGTPYDIITLKNGLRWVAVKDLEPGQYVAYPLPKFDEHEVVLDLAELTGYPFTNRYVYIGGNIKHKSDFPECYEYLKNIGYQNYNRGERKALLEQYGWDMKSFESAQQYIKNNLKPERIPRYVVVNEDIAYMFGLYIAEGYLGNGYVGFALCIDEESLAERAFCGCRRIDPSIDSYTFKRLGQSNGAYTLICSKVVQLVLERLFGKGAQTKRIPECIAHLPLNILAAFIKGIIDGDGCAFVENTASEFSDVRRYRISITSCNLNLLLQIRKLLLRFGLVGSITKHNKPGYESECNGMVIRANQNWHLAYRGSTAVRLASIIGYDVPVDAVPSRSASWFFVTNDYIFLRVIGIEMIEGVEHVIGFEVDVDDSFCVAGVATHNTKIPMGEVRLPRDAYEATHELHPDEFGEYGAFDRFAILADIAPYSDEYRLWRKIASQTVTDPELRKQMARIRKETAMQKKRYRLYPYRFLNKEIEKEKVTITSFIDANTFLTEEYPDTPIRLAGVRLTQESPLSDYLSVGQRVTIGINKDEEARISDDTLRTMRAVVYDSLGNLNLRLIRSGAGKEKETDYTPAGVYARFTEEEIRRGAKWESIAHMNIPLLSKFLSVSSPLEYYERQLVYGKEWSSWAHPYRDYIQPTFESAIHHGPLAATGIMSITGAIIGKLFGGTWRRAAWGAGIAGVIGAIGSVARIAKETISGETWIPERRLREREIDEYFDILEYMKYRGLYEYAKERALEEENVDVEELIREERIRGDIRERQIRELEERKRIIKLYYPEAGSELQVINKELRRLRGYRRSIPLTPWAAEALRYYGRMRSTLYGNFQDFYRALPAKDREFVQYFMETTDEEERRKILSLIPENQRRYYQAYWGMEVEEPPSLQEYFSTHYLPGPSWPGWRPDVSLDAIKLKVVKNEALDMSEFNMWPDDEREAKDAPEIENIREMNLNPLALAIAIESILNGRGLKDVRVSFTETSTPGIDVNFSMEYDRSEEIEEYMMDNFVNLIG